MLSNFYPHLKMRWQLVPVPDQVAERHRAPVLRALRLEGVPLHLVAERVDRLPARRPTVHPVHARSKEAMAACRQAL